jgi:hypothetical protein
MEPWYSEISGFQAFRLSSTGTEVDARWVVVRSEYRRSECMQWKYRVPASIKDVKGSDSGSRSIDVVGPWKFEKLLKSAWKIASFARPFANKPLRKKLS